MIKISFIKGTLYKIRAAATHEFLKKIEIIIRYCENENRFAANTQEHLNNYLRLNVNLSFKYSLSALVTLQFFITLMGPVALSTWCLARQSQTTYKQF